MDPAVQLAEFLLSTAPIPPSDMTTVVGSGPSNGFNTRPNVGWTGVAALHYMGTQISTGRGYSYNKVLDVNVPVTTSTELSYKIFPEPIGNDLSYPSTLYRAKTRSTRWLGISKIVRLLGGTR